MGSMIGIDLGTTNSVVAVLDGPQPRVLDSREGRSQTRSAVGLKLRRRTAEGAGEFQLLVGDPAFDNWPMAPRHTIVSIKRLMGRAIADPEVQRVRETWQYEIVQPSHGTEDSVRVVMGGRQYSPADVSAMVLGKLKADAELRLGAPVTHAVITVPAYFSEAQKAATREAGQKAGLSVIKLLDEPTAAAIAFGMEGAGSDETEYLLVFDLGGGTFDISVLMRAGSVFVPLNLQGDMWLGGDNFNALIVQRVVEHVRRQWSLDPTGNHRFMVSLQAAAQRAKEALSSASSTDIVLPGLLHDADGDLIDVEHTLTRAELEAMIGPSVERAMELTRVAIDKAGLGLEQIGHVLLAGNATMMPLVQREVARMFGPEKVLRRMRGPGRRHRGVPYRRSGGVRRLRARQRDPDAAVLQVRSAPARSRLRVSGAGPRAGGGVHQPFLLRHPEQQRQLQRIREQGRSGAHRAAQGPELSHPPRPPAHAQHSRLWQGGRERRRPQRAAGRGLCGAAAQSPPGQRAAGADRA